MLHREAVSPELLDILEFLSEQKELEPFRLVGGTALALQIGHRKSIDLDFFGQAALNEHRLTKILGELGTTTLLKKSENILIYSCSGVKVDFVNYRYQWLTEPVKEGNLNMAGKEDIGAMKINAVLGRGSRKDFIDLFTLLDYFSIEELLSFFTGKYPEGSIFLALKSLAYFEDAEFEPMPILLHSISWEKVKNRIKKEVIKLSL